MKVGIVDDLRCENFIQHENHQESYERLEVIRLKLLRKGLYDQLIKINPVPITLDKLPIDNKYRRTLSYLSTKSLEIGNDMIANKDTVKAALVAVGGVIAAVNTVITSKNIKKIFCNIRPPGHHASHDHAEGFCLLNNVAFGTQKALSYPEIQRVLIFDWDLHHGNGTENIFKHNSQVLYSSFHKADIYPGTGNHSYDNIDNHPFGEITVDESSFQDFETPLGVSKRLLLSKYMSEFYIFLKRAYEFKPDIVFISCGFDSHKDDLYHALPLDYEHFAIMTQELCKLANTCSERRLVSVLEGGYTLDVLAICAITHIQELINNC